MVLLTTTIAAFMSPFDSFVVNLALPVIGRSLNTELSLLAWIVVTYLLVSASFQATLGRLGDIIGKKTVFSLGIALFTIGSFLASLSPNIFILIGSRVVQGVGAAALNGTSAAIITDTFKADRGRALGINVASTYSGLSLGPLAGGFLAQYFGWRSIFYVNIPVGIIALSLALLYLPRGSRREETRKNFDILGALLLSVFLASLMLSLSRGELAIAPDVILMLVITCVVSLATFVVRESKFAAKPIIDLKLFTRNRLFAAGNVTAIFNYVTFGGTIFVIPIYLEFVRGFAPLAAGLILFTQPVMQAITAPIAGTLSDRIGARVLASAGMFIRSIGLFALSFLGLSSPPEAVWIPLIFIGLGHGFFSPPNTNSIMSSVSPDVRGIASGIIGTFRTASNSAGVVVMGAIIAASMPAGAFASMSAAGSVVQQGLADLFVLGMHYTFLFASAFSAIGVFTSLVRGKEQRR